jgi:hypothetical protein
VTRHRRVAPANRRAAENEIGVKHQILTELVGVKCQRRP